MGLRGPGAQSRVVDVFLPRDATWWFDRGRKITFYPFLVIVNYGKDAERGFWMPYWHTIEYRGRMQKKFGQWAPYGDYDLLADLITQARAKNYLFTQVRKNRPGGG